MATVLEECTIEEQHSILRVFWVNGLHVKDIVTNMTIARQRLSKHVPARNNGSYVLCGRMLQLIARQQFWQQKVFSM
jgi:hypothetical protein